MTSDLPAVEATGPRVKVGMEYWYAFGVKFRHGDSTFDVEIFARSFEEAQEMTRSIRGSAELEGQLIEKMPVNSLFGFLRVRMACWLGTNLGLSPVRCWQLVSFLLLLALILK